MPTRTNTKKTSDASEIVARLAGDRLRHEAGMEEARLIADAAEAIYNARKKARLTQAELAKMVGISQPAISAIEDGDTKGRSIASLAKVALALGISIKLSINPKRRKVRRKVQRAKSPTR